MGVVITHAAAGVVEQPTHPGGSHPITDLGAPMPGSTCGGSPTPGRMSMSKISVGRYTVAQAFGMSTTPEKRPSIGAAPRSR